VRPDFERGIPNPATAPRQNSFVATNSVRVELRKLDDVGRIIDAGLAGGATQVSTLQLGPQETGDARRRAIALAVADARQDAEALARAAGGSLGVLLSLATTNVGMAPGTDLMQYEYMQAARSYAGGVAFATPFNPREVTIAAMVYARWQFIPGSSRQ
jgi:uncharacterized protein YggE